jgi:hypothetical protein
MYGRASSFLGYLILQMMKKGKRKEKREKGSRGRGC